MHANKRLIMTQEGIKRIQKHRIEQMVRFEY
jgi:hypothetical protein